MKLKGLREKHILRRAVAKYLPKPIAERPKQPYRAPESECFAGSVCGWKSISSEAQANLV